MSMDHQRQINKMKQDLSELSNAVAKLQEYIIDLRERLSTLEQKRKPGRPKKEEVA